MLSFPVRRDKGMTHMVGKNWRDFFDVVIVQADKPHFFTDCIKWVNVLEKVVNRTSIVWFRNVRVNQKSIELNNHIDLTRSLQFLVLESGLRNVFKDCYSYRPFRRLDGNGDLRWEKINSLDKGQIYKQVCITVWLLCNVSLCLSCSCSSNHEAYFSLYVIALFLHVACFYLLHSLSLSEWPVVCGFSFVFQGNLFDFLRLTGWRGSKVLYFGDHLYSDLAVSVKARWCHHWLITALRTHIMSNCC